MYNLYKIDENYYYVYEHWLGDELIYIGKGRGDRAFSLNRNYRWEDKVRANLDNVKVVIKGYFENEEDALAFEETLIAKYLYEGLDITNIEYNFNHMEPPNAHLDVTLQDNPSDLTSNVEIKNKIEFNHNKQAISLMKKTIKNDKDSKIVVFFNSKYNKLISEIKKEDEFKVFVLSRFHENNSNTDKIKKINKELNAGIIPESYNVLIFPLEILNFDNTKIADPKVKLVIMNDRNEIKNKRALIRIKNNIDTLAYKVRWGEMKPLIST